MGILLIFELFHISWHKQFKTLSNYKIPKHKKEPIYLPIALLLFKDKIPIPLYQIIFLKYIDKFPCQCYDECQENLSKLDTLTK